VCQLQQQTLIPKALNLEINGQWIYPEQSRKRDKSSMAHVYRKDIAVNP
jgi:hypothetical protein